MRSDHRRAAAPRRARSALTVAVCAGVAVAGLVLLGAAGLAVASGALGGSRLVVSASVNGDTLARAVADRIAGALRYGIALDKLYGMTAYLDRLMLQESDVEQIIILDRVGTPLFQSGARAARVSAGVIRVEVPIPGQGGTPVGAVVAVMAPALANGPFERVGAVLLGTAVLAGLIAGAVAGVIARTHLDGARSRYAAVLDRMADGDFGVAVPPPAERDRFAPLAAAAAALAGPVAARFDRLRAEAQTIRAIDFDGSLATRLDPILARVGARFRIAAEDEAGAPSNRPADLVDRPHRDPPWALPAVIATLSLVAPYIANFAVDRGAAQLPPAFLAGVPVALHAVALIAGLGLASILPGGPPAQARHRAGLTALVLAIAGVVTGAVRWCRDFAGFNGLLLGSGLAAGLALGLLLAGQSAAAPTAAPPGPARRLCPLQGSLLAAALLVGPLAGGVLGDVAGRRFGFLIAGALTIGLALAIAVWWRPGGSAVPGRALGAPRSGRRPVAAAVCDGLAAGTAGGAAILVILPGHGFFLDYFLAGSLSALAGAAGLIAFGMLSRLGPVAGAAIAAGIFLIDRGTTWPEAGAGALLPAGVVLFGAGIGILLRRAGTGVGGPGFAAVVGGIALGAVSVGASTLWFSTPGALAAAAAFALPLCADLLCGRLGPAAPAAVAPSRGT